MSLDRSRGGFVAGEDIRVGSPSRRAVVQFLCGRFWKSAGISRRGDRSRRPGLDAAGQNEPAAWPLAGRHYVSRKEHDILFSIGYVDPAECIALRGDVSHWKIPALACC